MSPSKLNKNTLLDKYVRGIISEDEMHLLNQMALDDDFLFDTLEGLAAHEPNNLNSIKELNSRIQSKKKKSIPILYWISAAASIIIVVVAVNFITNKSESALNETFVMEDLPVEDETGDLITLADVKEEKESLKIDNPPAKKAKIETEAPVPELKIKDLSEAEEVTNISDDEIAISNVKKEIATLDNEVELTPVPTPSSVPIVTSENISEQDDLSKEAGIAIDAEPAQKFSRRKQFESVVEKAASASAISFTPKISSILISKDVDYILLSTFQLLSEYLNNNIIVESRKSLSVPNNEFIVEMSLDESNQPEKINLVKGIEFNLDQQIIKLLMEFDQWGNYKDQITGKIKLKFEFEG